MRDFFIIFLSSPQAFALMRISRASAKEYFIQRAKIALNFATTKFLIFFEVGRECEFYELGEFYELSEFGKRWTGNANLANFTN